MGRYEGSVIVGAGTGRGRAGYEFVIVVDA